MHRANRRSRVVSGIAAASIVASIFMYVTVPATAAPIAGDWANVPGYSGGEVSIGQAGGVNAVHTTSTPSGVDMNATTTVVNYDTGVVQSDGTQGGYQTIIVPSGGATGKALVYLPPIDSLAPVDRATVAAYNPFGSSIDWAVVNYYLSQGYSVVIPNAYGEENPTYAGKNNGVRVRNGMVAALSLLGPQQFTVYGQSGGAIDTSFAAESTGVIVPGDEHNVYIAEDNPRDLLGMFVGSGGRVPSGLIDSAAVGMIRSMSSEDKVVLDRTIRPSVKYGAQVLNVTQDYPVPLVSSLTYMLLGVFAPQDELLFRRGTYDSAEVQDVLQNVNALQGTPQGKVYLLPKTHDRFVDKSGSYWLANEYRSRGVDVQVIETNDGGEYPGHYASEPEFLFGVGSGAYDSQGDFTRVTGEKSDITSRVLEYAAETIIPAVGEVVNAALTPVLDVVDAGIDAAEYVQALHVTSVPAIAPSAPPATSNVARLNEIVDTAVPTYFQTPAKELLNNPLVSDLINNASFSMPAA